MSAWKPELKNYPHFDAFLPEHEILNIVTDEKRVTQNAFYPFLQFRKLTKQFGRLKKKERTIRYACRRDSYIYAYYRTVILLPLYEKILLDHGIQNHVIAYRRIPVDANSKSNKCNIHFANDAFKTIKKMRNCIVVAIDITKFYDSLDHEKLRRVWCNILNVSELPPDHAAIFKSITQYRFIDRDECYNRLGISNDNPVKKRLCSPQDFRNKICGNDETHQKLIQKNAQSYGIPQGAPISDLLANLYLLEFDKAMSQFAKELNGYYMRYSDDILLIFKREELQAQLVIQHISALINEHKLTINDKKTSVTEFYDTDGVVKSRPCILESANTSNKKMEYLGFQFDGENILIKDSTLSSYYRKLTFYIRSLANKLAMENPDLSADELIDKCNFSNICTKFGKVKDFTKKAREYSKWTFWSYAKRASQIMGNEGSKILHQLSRRKSIIKQIIRDEIEKQLKRRKPSKRVTAQ